SSDPLYLCFCCGGVPLQAHTEAYLLALKGQVSGLRDPGRRPDPLIDGPAAAMTNDEVSISGARSSCRGQWSLRVRIAAVRAMIGGLQCQGGLSAKSQARRIRFFRQR